MVPHSHNPIDVFPIAIKIIITGFVHDKKKNQQTATDPDRKAEDIDERKQLFFPQMLKG